MHCLHIWGELSFRVSERNDPSSLRSQITASMQIPTAQKIFWRHCVRRHPFNCPITVINQKAILCSPPGHRAAAAKLQDPTGPLKAGAHRPVNSGRWGVDFLLQNPALKFIVLQKKVYILLHKCFNGKTIPFKKLWETLYSVEGVGTLWTCCAHSKERHCPVQDSRVTWLVKPHLRPCLEYKHRGPQRWGVRVFISAMCLKLIPSLFYS